MLAVMVLNHHRVLLSEIVRPFVPFGTRYMGHAIRMWSAVCSATPYSLFGQGAITHLCMDERNRSTPIRRRLSLTQAARGKLIPTGLALVLGIKTWILEVFLLYQAFHLWFVHSEARMPNPARLFKRFRVAGTNGRLDLILSWRASENLLRRPYKV